MRSGLGVGLLAAFLAAVCSAPASGESGWVEAAGEAVVDDARPLADIRQEALGKARRSALERAAGVEVRSETVVRDMATQHDFVSQLTHGTIIEEVVDRWEYETVPEGKEARTFLVLRVYLRARVAVEKGPPDPGFKVTASANRYHFKNGDDVVLRIASTRSCYVTVLVITEDDRVFSILPNRYRKSVSLAPEAALVYPSGDDLARGITLKAGLLPGADRAKETIRVIATKRPLQFRPESVVQGVGLDAFRKGSATVKELIGEIMTIPRDERADAFLSYEISR